MDYANGEFRARVRRASATPRLDQPMTIEGQLPVLFLLAFAGLAAIQLLLQG